ncbi:MAG TPA: hypothetical protein VNR39_12430 [Pseudolabrys sp.]|nr:hypothetical protein [Pseudolabrys sp.]
MRNDFGQEFTCDEETARSFERRGTAQRVSSSSAKARKLAADRREELAGFAAFVAGVGATAEQFAHLEAAIVEGAEAAGRQRTAAAIVEAGKVARAGGHHAEPTGVAAQIIAAGKKARGEKL